MHERKERVMQEIHRKVRADEAVTDAEWAAWKAFRGIGSSSSGGQKRKRKKKRKRKLPRNSSHPRMAARHLGRYGPEGHFCRDTVTASVARAVRTWKPGLSTSHWYLVATCSVLVLPEECCGGFFWEITSGFFPYSALFGSTVDTCVCQSSEACGLAGCDAPRAVCCIMASMDQQEQFVYWSCLMCTGFLDFMGDDFMLVSVFSAELGSTADTSTASVYGAFCRSPY